MKSGGNQFFGKEFSELAGEIEQQFFRIERESRWLSSAVNGLIAGAAVGVVAWLASSLQQGDLMLFACLGSSAASVVFSPLSKNNSLRTIILAYIAASIVCVILFPIREYHYFPTAFQCFLAVSVSIFLMRIVEAMHPAAIGSAMAFLIFDRDITSIVVLLSAILGLLFIVKVLAYIYLEDLTFRDFPKEFHRAYYGREMTLILEPEQVEDTDSESNSDVG